MALVREDVGCEQETRSESGESTCYFARAVLEIIAESAPL